jgi:extracellular factor (EF) 3-hydroxypalmitic acid methyl ester biosynthesis protein
MPIDKSHQGVIMSNAAAKKIEMPVHSPYVIRQDRMQLRSRNLTLKINEDIFYVVNFSVFGIAFEAAKDFSIGDTLGCELRYDGIKISDFSLEIRRKDLNGDNFYYGCETLDSVIPVEEISYLDKSYSLLEEVNEKYQRYEAVPEKVKYYIDDLFIWLNEVEEKVKAIETSHFENVKQKHAAYRNTIKIVGDAICEKLKSSNGMLGRVLDGNSNTKLIFEYYRYRLGKFIFQSPFTKRSFEKPKGYAGDFEMMNQIYRNDYFAHSLFGGCMEAAVSLHEEPTAVRNRVVYLSEKILEACKQKGSINILAVASGPAEEIKAVISRLDAPTLARVTYTLLDQDEDALRYAQKNIKEQLVKEGKDLKVNLLSKDVKDLIISGLSDEFDLIYSAGLFDYFSDPVATRACKVLFKCLKGTGKLVIGNFNADAPNTFGMLALFDWFLILRNERDLERIFHVVGSKVSVEREPENVNLFCVIEKA